MNTRAVATLRDYETYDTKCKIIHVQVLVLVLFTKALARTAPFAAAVGLVQVRLALCDTLLV